MRPLAFLLIAAFGLTAPHRAAAELLPLGKVVSIFNFGKKKPAEPVPEKIDDTKRKLADRVMKPDLNKTYEPSKGSPSTDRSVKSRSASSKEFSTRGFASREFYSRDFYGSKGAYLSKTKVATPEASTKGQYEIPNASTAAPTKTMDVTSARDANKAMETREMPGSSREFVVKGRSQDQLDIEQKTGTAKNKPLGYGGDLKTLTLEDIRELLNKNK